MKKRYIYAALCTAVLCTASGIPSAAMTKIADGETLLFDFGGSTDGWYPVSTESIYSPEAGYGFNTTEYNTAVTGSGTGCQNTAIELDAQRLDDISFNIDVEPGMYEVCIYAGDIENMAAKLEGYPSIMNLMYKNAYQQVEIPVTDGQLNISLMKNFDGNESFGFKLAGISVKRTGDLSTRKKRVFICSDSIAAEYSPDNLDRDMADTDRGGWGQMLRYYIPKSLYVHNLSIPGSCAADFISKKQLDSLVHYMHPGDYALISFGINDFYSKYTPEEFAANIGTIIDAVKNAGGIPVVLSEIAPLSDFDEWGGYTANDVCFAAELPSIAAAHNVPFIDIHSLSASYLGAIGYNASCKLFWNMWNTGINYVHPNREGAGHIARLIAEQLVNLQYTDFDAGINGYGVSPDMRLKCHIHDDRFTLVNTAPYRMTYRITVTGTDCSRSYSVTLPPYNVLAPDNEYDVMLNLSNPDRHTVLSGYGFSLDLN